MNTLARIGRTVGLSAALLMSAHTATSAPTTTISRILYGNSYEYASAVAVDASGNSHVTGTTSSTYSFPAGTGAPTTHGYKSCSPGPSCSSAFIVKIDSAGNIVASVLFGGSGSTRPMALAVDGSYVYVAGATNSPAITTAAGRYPTVAYIYGAAPSGTNSRSFQAKFSLGLDTLYTVTTLGASDSSEAHGMVVDGGGSTYLTGQTCGFRDPVTNWLNMDEAYTDGGCDVFVAHLDHLGMLSGSGGPSYFARFGSYQSDVANAIAVDASGAAWVAGRACTAHFPVTAGLSRGSPDINHCTAFVTKLDPSGSTYQYSTTFGGMRSDYFGAGWRDEATAITLNGSSGVYVGGFSQSNDFPTTAAAGHSPLQATSTCNMKNNVAPYCYQTGFVAYLDAGLNLRAATYLGGTQLSQVYGIAKNSQGEVYVTGSISSNSAGFPGASKANFVATGGYLTKLSGSLETLGWTMLYGGPVKSILAKGSLTSTGLWTAGDTYPNTSNSDSFMIKWTESSTTGGICRTCVIGR